MRSDWRTRWSSTRRPSCGRRSRHRTPAPRCASNFAKDVLAELEVRKRRRRHPRLRRPAHPAGRRARRRRLTGSAADASALADRDGRRVPGHRPGAVEGDRPRVHRPLHADPDRRPEAGHLRVPRRRHRHLPQGRRNRGRAKDSRQELAQRRRAGEPAAGAAGRRAARGRADHRARGRGALPRHAPHGRPVRRAFPAARRAAGTVRLQRDPDASRSAICAHTSRATSRPTSVHC